MSTQVFEAEPGTDLCRLDTEVSGMPGHCAIRRFRSGWQVRAASFPATEFTGDFYITSEIGDSVWFAVGDFSGHGLGAAVFSMMVREELERVIDYCRQTCLVEIVEDLDCVLRDEFPSNRFASLVVGCADADGLLTLVNAGHCHPLVLRPNGRIEPIGTGGPVVGIVPRPAWSSVTTRLGEGDRLLIYTDGLLEARNEHDDEFGADRIAALASGTTTERTLDTLTGEVSRFTKGRFEDDLTLFVLSR